MQCGDFYNRLDDKVEKHDLYFVLNVFNIKKGEFFLVWVTVDVKLPVFLLFIKSFFSYLSITFCLLCVLVFCDFKLYLIELICLG